MDFTLSILKLATAVRQVKFQDYRIVSQKIIIDPRDKLRYFVITEFNKAILHFHARAITTRRKAWFHLRMSKILFAATQLDDIGHEQTIICRQLLSGHVVDSPPIKSKANLHRMIMVYSRELYEETYSDGRQYGGHHILCGNSPSVRFKAR